MSDSYNDIALPSRVPATAQDGLNQPSKPVPQRAMGGASQRDRRFTDTFFDMHRSARFPRGRPWWGEREVAANADLGHDAGFVGELSPGEYVTDEGGAVDRRSSFASVWSAPWYPPAKLFQYNYKRKLVTFAYQKGLVEEQNALRQYYHAAAVLGNRLGLVVTEGKVPPFQITQDLGLPSSMVHVYRAAIAGDPWLLGHIDEPNVELARALGFSASGLRIVQEEPPAPIVTPQQVLAAPDISALLAEMQRMRDELQAIRDKEQAKKDQMAKVRAARKSTPTAA